MTVPRLLTLFFPLVIVAAIGCASSSPSLITFPTPVSSLTAEDAIEWLRSAGLSVEIIEDEKEATSLFGDGRKLGATVTRVSVDKYDRVWVYEFDTPQSLDEVFLTFDRGGDYAPESYPTAYALGNVVVLVRGVDFDLIKRVYLSLWNRLPTYQIASIGIIEFRLLDGNETVDEAKRWFADPSAASDVETRIQRLGDYVSRFTLTRSNYPVLPHPDSLVWVVQGRSGPQAPASQAYSTIVIDFATNIVLGATYSQERLPLDRIAEIERLDVPQLTTIDGASNEFDELATILTLSVPESVLIIPQYFEEVPLVSVVERASSPDGPWQVLEVVGSRPYPFRVVEPNHLIAPPDGRAIIDKDAREIRYWDWEVEDGKRYFYRVYACTSLYRRTAYSNVASAVAGDPNPATPHPYEQPIHELTPPCQG